MNDVDRLYDMIEDLDERISMLESKKVVQQVPEEVSLRQYISELKTQVKNLEEEVDFWRIRADDYLVRINKLELEME